jgi:hypothetical protein
MITQFMHVVAFKNAEALESFEIIGLVEQAKQTNCLCRYLIQTNGLLECEPLLEIIHLLLGTIMCPKNPVNTHISCLTNQTVCPSLLRLNWTVRKANVHTHWYTMCQHGFFDITIHTVHLKLGGQTTFMPIDIDGAPEDTHGNGYYHAQE